MTKHIRSSRRLIALLVALSACSLASVALADIPSHGSDETIANAYPLQTGIAVKGAFVNQSDQDYLRFTVAKAGQTVRFTLHDTTPSSTCNHIDPNQAGCLVYATLMGSTGQNQVGGSTSDAGTIASAGDTESFSWTFAQSGTYYVLMESDGDLPNGSPTYTFLLGPPAAHVTGLRLSHTHASPRAAVRFRLVGAAKTLRLSVRTAPATGSGRLVMRRTLHGVHAGRHSASFALPTWLKTRLAHGHSVPVVLDAGVTSGSGAHTHAVKHTVLRP